MPVFDFDAYSPAQISERVEAIGVRKARLPLRGSILLGIIAGAHIGLGALYFVVIVSDPTLSFAVSRAPRRPGVLPGSRARRGGRLGVLHR